MENLFFQTEADPDQYAPAIVVSVHPEGNGRHTVRYRTPEGQTLGFGHYVDTFRGKCQWSDPFTGQGLCLHGGSPAANMTGTTRANVIAWLDLLGVEK